jgi:hypothetical protein
LGQAGLQYLLELAQRMGRGKPTVGEHQLDLAPVFAVGTKSQIAALL